MWASYRRDIQLKVGDFVMGCDNSFFQLRTWNMQFIFKDSNVIFRLKVKLCVYTLLFHRHIGCIQFTTFNNNMLIFGLALLVLSSISIYRLVFMVYLTLCIYIWTVNIIRCAWVDSSIKVYVFLTLFISNRNNLWQIHKKNNKHLQNKWCCFLLCVFIFAYLVENIIQCFPGARLTQLHLDWDHSVGPKSPSTRGCSLYSTIELWS